MNIDVPIPITKMSGAGNDFIIIDHRVPFISEQLQPQFVQMACRRRFSVGADGVIFIENSSSADFRWRFYNRDGSVAEMCGNGARCAARYAYRRNIAPQCMSFETLAGRIEAEIIGEQEHVSIRMTDPHGFTSGHPVILGDRQASMTSINTGVPHAVIFVATNDTPVVAWGRQVRFDERFKPAGTNVNFVKTNPDGSLYVRTYERGVEEETMACGTGVVASALVAAIEGRSESPVDVTTSGGEQLTVQFELSGQHAQDVYLQGAARIIYEGELSAEALL